MNPIIKVAAAIVIIALAAAACTNNDLPFSDPTPTRPPPRPTLPSPIAHLVPDQCQDRSAIPPPDFSQYYWGIVLRGDHDRPDVITVTSLKASNETHEDIDWHNLGERILAPWGVAIPEDQAAQDAARRIKNDVVRPGEYVKIVIRHDQDIIAATTPEPLPAVIIDQDNRIWSLELIMKGAAHPDQGSQFITGQPGHCFNEAARVSTAPEPPPH